LRFDDPGAQNDEPAKGVTVGDIRAWYDTLLAFHSAVCVEVNERGAGGFLLARLRDARDMLDSK
jgi:hypothetical protein